MSEAKVLFDNVILVLLVTVFIIGFSKQQNLALSGVELRLERIICYCNPKYCKFTTCNVKFISRERADGNLVVTTIKNITALTYHLKTYYKFSNNEYRPILIDVTTDFCAAEMGLSSIMHKYLKTVWRNHTNLFQPCPLLPGEYYVKDFNFGAHHLPSIIPAGRYLINATARLQSDELFVNTSVYFYVANHGVLDLGMG